MINSYDLQWSIVRRVERTVTDYVDTLNLRL